MELNNETKVIALLSGYVRELNEGGDYLDTTYKAAEAIVNMQTQEIEKFIMWYVDNKHEYSSNSMKDTIKAYLND